MRRKVEEWRPSTVTLGAATFPLLVLFGLNAVDELDRAAFAVLLPDIRDHFRLDDSQALAIVAVTTVAVLLIEVPLSFYCDRRNRVRIATAGAAIWALFSVGTGLAVVGRHARRRPHRGRRRAGGRDPDALVAAVRLLRAGSPGEGLLGPPPGQLGRADPGPAGGRRAGPALRLAGAVLRVRRSRRPSSSSSRCACASPCAACTSAGRRAPTRSAAQREDAHESIRSTMRILAEVRTIRRIWWAVPFLAIVLFGVPNLLSLVYEDVYGLDSAARGVIAAGVEPLQIAGRVHRHPARRRHRDARPGVPAAVRGRRRRRRRGAARHARLRPERGGGDRHARPARPRPSAPWPPPSSP